MDSFLHLINEWGYWAVFFGSTFEGESIILTASFLAHEGYLELWKVMAIAFTGTLVADQGLYHIGRHYGSHFLDRYPKLKEPSDKAFQLLRRYGDAYIIIFRFIYGLRVISPVIIGMAGIGMKRFTILNIIAAVVWTVISCLAGYFFAHVVMDVFEQYSKYILIGFCTIVGTIYVTVKVRKHLRRKREPSS